MARAKHNKEIDELTSDFIRLKKRDRQTVIFFIKALLAQENKIKLEPLNRDDLTEETIQEIEEARKEIKRGETLTFEEALTHRSSIYKKK